MRRVRLEPSDPGQHAERLLGWLRQPHVAWWWGDAPQAMEQVMRCVPEMPAVVAADGVAVDYLCWQKPPRQELEAADLTDLPEGLVDIDLLIGAPAARGRGRLSPGRGVGPGPAPGRRRGGAMKHQVPGLVG